MQTAIKFVREEDAGQQVLFKEILPKETAMCKQLIAKQITYLEQRIRRPITFYSTIVVEVMDDR